eukprot:2152-Rhodomonas_salina.1
MKSWGDGDQFEMAKKEKGVCRRKEALESTAKQNAEGFSSVLSGTRNVDIRLIEMSDLRPTTRLSAEVQGA